MTESDEFSAAYSEAQKELKAFCSKISSSDCTIRRTDDIPNEASFIGIP